MSKHRERAEAWVAARHMLYPRDVLIESLAELLAAVERETVERCAQVAESEAELPGAPTEAMRRALEDRPDEVARACVSVTKRNIASAIRRLSAAEPGEVGRG